MRGDFFKEFIKLMAEDESTYFLTADMGLGLIEPFVEKWPLRTRNVGIAEANMIGISAGLCNAGFRPFCYTISNFLIERAFEQIRNDICLHEYPVVLVGTSTGFDNGILGPTHHVIDEIGCIKGLPHIEVISPTTVSSILVVMDYLKTSKNPTYVRIGKGTFEAPGFKFSKLNEMVLDRGGSTLVITHGTQFENSYKAVEKIEGCSLFAMNKMHPVSPEEILPFFKKYSKIVVVEDQMINSGLYNSLCQLLVQSKIKTVDLIPHCTPNEYSPEVGHKDYFEKKYNFTPDRLESCIKKYISA